MYERNNSIPDYLTKFQRSIIAEPIPDNLIFLDPQKNKYVTAMVVVQKLNDIFGHAWSFKILDKGTEDVIDNKTNAKIGSYVWVLGELAYPVTDPADGKTIWVTKTAIGGKQLVGGAKVQSQGYKSASADSLKKCASLLGLANNVYMNDNVYEALDECDADAWTDSKVEVFASEVKEMQELKAKWGVEEFGARIKAFCDDTGDYTTRGEITPSNIQHFLAYTKKQAEKPSAKPTGTPTGLFGKSK